MVLLLYRVLGAWSSGVSCGLSRCGTGINCGGVGVRWFGVGQLTRRCGVGAGRGALRR
jgi:hypothetical protein